MWVCVGIIDISKTYLYEFHYEYMINAELCTLIRIVLFIKCNNVYGTMKSDIQFDTSDYAADNVYDIPLANRKDPSLMKDKNNAIVIEFMKIHSSCRVYAPTSMVQYII